jgi:ABC-type phosphate/phosphonate transport system substrate-binding protein
MLTLKKQMIFGVVALAMIGSLVWCATSAAVPVRKGNSLVIGYSAKIFYNADPRDVIGLTKVWARLADSKLKFSSETDVVFYKTTADAECALANNEVDILVMIPEEYVHMRASIPLSPVLSADYGKNFYDELILMVRMDSGVTRVAQLRGKNLRVEAGQKGSIPIQWLDSLLAARVLPEPQGFFAGISEFPKASQVIMPVFFGQADACLTSRNSFNILSELNPQLGRQMLVLERSPGFVTGLITVRKDIRNPRRDTLVEILQEMQNDPKGKQLLTLFRCNRLGPFRPEHLASVEKVLRESRVRSSGLARRKR